MLTCCPNCATNFRVTPAQLKARAGTVRCGQCNLVFNALETLADDPLDALVETSPLPTPPATIVPTYEPTPELTGDTSDTGIDEAEAEFEIEPEVEVEAEVETEALADQMPTGAAEETEAETEGNVAEPAPAQVEEATTPPKDYLSDPLLHESTVKARHWPWAIGSIVAVLGLLAQGAYYYRIELAVLRPDLRPALQAACEPLHCEVPRPRSIDTLGIDTSDLRPNPQRHGHLMLTATLRSKAVYAQEWPLLELTLTDVADNILTVKHFTASDYLPNGKDKGLQIEAGFPANGEIAVKLPLDVGDLPAAGYRLYIFYP
ncbi:MAG: DUF3426 domain-containing protein [Georgfuchsia sp.]